MLAGVALEVKEGLATQALFPARRAEAASNHHPRERILALFSTA
jgi:hypothetical protein